MTLLPQYLQIPKALDPRIYQAVFLGSFLLLGICTRDWALKPEIVLTAIGACALHQLIAKSIFQPQENPWPSLQSSLITSLGLSLLLRTNHPSTMFLAAGLAIWSKFLLCWGDKHIFNPANFGIIVTLWLTDDAWVSPGQWGEDWLYLLLFIGTGSLVLKKVGRWDTSVSFLAAYAGFEALRSSLYLGWTWDVWGHKLMSGSLVMFALFMVTDPRAIPNARSARLVWSIAIAALTFVLRNYFYLSDAVFYALFMLSPLTLVLDWWWRGQTFSWNGANLTAKSPTPIT